MAGNTIDWVVDNKGHENVMPSTANYPDIHAASPITFVHTMNHMHRTHSQQIPGLPETGPFRKSDIFRALLFFSFFLILAFGIYLQNPFLFSIDTLFDQKVFTFDEHHPVVIFMNAFTMLASAEVMMISLVLLLGILLGRKRWRDASGAIVLFAGGNALVHLFLKPYFDRTRPEGILVYETDASFPSGHTFAAGLIVFLVWIVIREFDLKRREEYFFFFGSGLYVLLILSSRLVLHAHFLTDVLASLFLALFWGMAISCFSDRGGQKSFPRNQHRNEHHVD